MFIKKGRLLKENTLRCIDMSKKFNFLGDYETYEHRGVNYIKCFSDVIIKHDNIDGKIHLKKGNL